ncbi:hypothetical protein KSP40_PGU001338 [Platanthera guangdongensis]|uniref:Uncharacterized protein n=1 Tax=Platanthera guangdongensis TaxID=2320717 RepID=A0ABR2MMF2_9ASPA
MEEAKAAAYYEELTRKGEGAARFKQGLGFSTTTSYVSFPPKPSSSYSSPFSNFVRACSPCKTEKQAQLETIQAKLRGSRRSPSPNLRPSELQRGRREKEGSSRRRSSSKELRAERDRDRSSRSRDGRRCSRSFSLSEEDGADHGQSRNGRRDRDSSPRENMSRSPMILSSRDSNRRDKHMITAEKNDRFDYPILIKGYSQMTPAERVKAKMKLQLSQTAAKDSTMVMSIGWERFNFNKDAPLDDDDNEIDVVEDDASLVKEIGNCFRFTAVQAKRKEEIKAAHDEAMFGVSKAALIIPESETNKVGDVDDGGSGGGTEMANNEKQHNNILISDKVLAIQQGSWRDRVKRFKSGFDS